MTPVRQKAPILLDTAWFVAESRIREYKPCGTSSTTSMRTDTRSPAEVPEEAASSTAWPGRDREKSASYYPPQVLTRCLVKYALKELLSGHQPPMTSCKMTV